MGRKSEREQRRKEILQAFAKVLANHGYAGATINAVALEAGLSPGLLHHHFHDKHEMLEELCRALIMGFKARVENAQARGQNGLDAYLDAALKLDQNADLVSARCWVGVFAEALRSPSLFAKIKRYLENEIETLERTAKGTLDAHGSSALLAFILGSLVFGSFAPKKASGFAAPSAKKLAKALRKN